MSIDMVKIRAEISIGSLKVKTPFILSFSVNKQRGQISTFSARLKVSETEVSGVTGGSVKIKAGRNSASNTIFSGIVKKATVQPCWEDPSYVLLNISGADILSTLEGKKYSRRSTATESSWISIDSVVREGYRGSKFAARLVKDEKVDTVSADLNPGAETAAFIQNLISRAGGRSVIPGQPQMNVEVKIENNPLENNPL